MRDPVERQRQRARQRERAEEHPGDDEPSISVETFTAAELLAMDLPEPRWAVEGLLPEGMNLLAGKPKLGKSWLALNLGNAQCLRCVRALDALPDGELPLTARQSARLLLRVDKLADRVQDTADELAALLDDAGVSAAPEASADPSLN